MALTTYVDRLKLNNEVAGFKFAVVGVFYAAMLVAFVVIAVWDDFRKTETAVRDEAKAAVDCTGSPLPPVPISRVGWLARDIDGPERRD